MDKYLAQCLEKRNRPEEEKTGLREAAFASFLPCSGVVLGVLRECSHIFSEQPYKVGVMISPDR